MLRYLDELMLGIDQQDVLHISTRLFHMIHKEIMKDAREHRVQAGDIENFLGRQTLPLFIAFKKPNYNIFS